MPNSLRSPSRRVWASNISMTKRPASATLPEIQTCHRPRNGPTGRPAAWMRRNPWLNLASKLRRARRRAPGMPICRCGEDAKWTIPNHRKSLDGGLPMLCARMIPQWLAACSFLALGACGSSAPQLNTGSGPSVPVPPSYGLYAYDGDQLIRLDGDGNWERSTWSDRSDLPPKIEFIVYNRSLTTDSTPLQDLVELRRVAHVRNDVRGSGNVVPAQNNRWAAPDLPDYRIALNFTPVPGHSDVVVAAPSDPLAPGLYSFSLQARPQPLELACRHRLVGRRPEPICRAPIASTATPRAIACAPSPMRAPMIQPPAMQPRHRPRRERNRVSRQP